MSVEMSELNCYRCEEQLNKQATAERTRAERAEADYGTLKLAAGDMSRVLQAGYVSPAEYQQTLTELERILSQPHPGDPLREELEGLRTQARTGKTSIDILLRRLSQAQTEAQQLRGLLREACRRCDHQGDDILLACKSCSIEAALNAGKE
jgi:tRNA C32,U32 (ribose-2'-O)-methylase TrmJ